MPDKPRRRPLAAVGAVLACGVAAASALAGASPGLVGSPGAGKPIFEANCSACHTLKAAGAHGQVGPDLDRLSLTEQTIIEQIRDGDPVPTGKAAPTTQMVAYEGVLSATQIDNLAAFVYTAEHR